MPVYRNRTMAVTISQQMTWELIGLRDASRGYFCDTNTWCRVYTTDRSSIRCGPRVTLVRVRLTIVGRRASIQPRQKSWGRNRQAPLFEHRATHCQDCAGGAFGERSRRRTRSSGAIEQPGLEVPGFRIVTDDFLQQPPLDRQAEGVRCGVPLALSPAAVRGPDRLQ